MGLSHIFKIGISFSNHIVTNMKSFCKKCHHPCHCGEEKELHADEYGVCTCEGCECKQDKEEV
jgi:hypothetical protein